ncbi:hypothetical protein H6762_01465 [Candidatus Nomurabacteria bacterium]|uniref:Uncharacterized protein n=1 Tax=Candidatus Dojkabacteria bacterium TaxID=2099670 RepID=A0A955KX79_9BACT|nr:hypothetical protein [Candidatus Dojkabacteria bacterium]MCB9789645.1 hypothetical protein [Candidatus Nomurabacteria bacterium]
MSESITHKLTGDVCDGLYRLKPIETEDVGDLQAEVIRILGLPCLQDTDIRLFCVFVQPRDKRYQERVLVANITKPQDTTVVISANDAYPQIAHDGTVSPHTRRELSIYRRNWGSVLAECWRVQQYQANTLALGKYDRWHRLPDLFSDEQGNIPPIEQLPPQTILFMQRHLRMSFVTNSQWQGLLRNALNYHKHETGVGKVDYFGLIPVLGPMKETRLYTTSYTFGSKPVNSVFSPQAAFDHALLQSNVRWYTISTELRYYDKLVEKYGFRTELDN